LLFTLRVCRLAHVGGSVNSAAHMKFKTATDELLEKGVTLPEIAEALGAAYTTVRAWRLDPASPSYRTPPDDWAPSLAKLVRTRHKELGKLAEQLERES
jgi:hypothetical protein